MSILFSRRAFFFSPGEEKPKSVLDVPFPIPNGYLIIQLPQDSKTMKGWELLGILFDGYFELFYNEIYCLAYSNRCHILSLVPEKELSSSFKDGSGPQKLNTLACTSWKENQVTTCPCFTAFFSLQISGILLSSLLRNLVHLPHSI